MNRLGALDIDIRMVTERLARVTNNDVPLLPDGLQRAMLCTNSASNGAVTGSRKRKSCDMQSFSAQPDASSSVTEAGPLAQPGESTLCAGSLTMVAFSVCMGNMQSFSGKSCAIAPVTEAGLLAQPGAASISDPAFTCGCIVASGWGNRRAPCSVPGSISFLFGNRVTGSESGLFWGRTIERGCEGIRKGEDSLTGPGCLCTLLQGCLCTLLHRP